MEGHISCFRILWHHQQQLCACNPPGYVQSERNNQTAVRLLAVPAAASSSCSSAIETAADRTDWSTEFSWSEQGDEQIALENGICCLLKCVDMHAKERSIPFYCMRMAQQLTGEISARDQRREIRIMHGNAVPHCTAASLGEEELKV